MRNLFKIVIKKIVYYFNYFKTNRNLLKLKFYFIYDFCVNKIKNVIKI